MADLLEKLTDEKFDNLPAVPDRFEQGEPVEPSERSDVFERGREPSEVVQDPHEARLPADEPQYEIQGRSYTAKQLEESGKLTELAAAHSKYAALQEQYAAQVAERQAAQAQQPAAPAISNRAISQVYDSVAEIITQDLVRNDLIEADLPEAYPRAVQTLIGQMRFAFDLLFSMREEVMPVIGEIQRTKEKVQGAVVANAYYGELDSLVRSDPQFFAALRNQKTRDKFTAFLVDEVGATVGQTTGQGAQAFLKRQWSAFNSDTILDAAKSGVETRRQRSVRRFVGGESTGSRMGVSNLGESSLLDRMISNSGKLGE